MFKTINICEQIALTARINIDVALKLGVDKHFLGVCIPLVHETAPASAPPPGLVTAPRKRRFSVVPVVEIVGVDCVAVCFGLVGICNKINCPVNVYKTIIC